MKSRYYILITLFLSSSNVLSAINCSNPKDECVEAGGTRYFDGAPVTLSCWRYKTTYECKAESDDNCKQLAAEGCSPASATCRTMWGGVCAVQDMVYDCPTRICNGYEIVCNDGRGFCLTGDCASHERSKDTDMYRALAALSAAAEASKYYAKNLTIFKGKSEECSRNAVGFKNCCKGHSEGWGTKVKLAECSDDEETLAKQKDAGLTAEIGEYCHNKTPLGCTSYHQTYCVFSSKIGRIIRVAARDQLGLGFGRPELADCSGLTPEQFQHLDFSKVDFSELYQDIKNKQKVQLADKVNPIMQQKSEGLKTKLQGDAKDTIKRADELRIRK